MTIAAPLSCDELYRKRGLKSDGTEIFADIDPDGYKIGKFPIRVKCIMKDGMLGKTFLHVFDSLLF